MALPATELRTKTQADFDTEKLLHTAHQRAVHATPAEMAAFMQKLLGQQLTALMTNSADPKAVGKWARGERAPRQSVLRKLRDGYHVAVLLSLAEDEQTARGWFMGMNPYLADLSPIKVIASEPEGGEQAMNAALAFISYG